MNNDSYHTSGSFTRRIRDGVGAVKSDEVVIENVLENVTFLKIHIYLFTTWFFSQYSSVTYTMFASG
jgi:hypothetical protein